MSPKTPLSERIIKAIVAQLQQISPKNGYLTDAGGSVFRARSDFDESELPAIAVWEGNEVAEGGATSSRVMSIKLPIVIEAITLCNKDETGELLGQLKADIKRAMLEWDNDGGLKDDQGKLGALTYNGAQPVPRRDGSSFEGVAVTFTANFSEARGQPWHASHQRTT